MFHVFHLFLNEYHKYPIKNLGVVCAVFKNRINKLHANRYQ